MVAEASDENGCDGLVGSEHLIIGELFERGECRLDEVLGGEGFYEWVLYRLHALSPQDRDVELEDLEADILRSRMSQSEAAGVEGETRAEMRAVIDDIDRSLDPGVIPEEDGRHLILDADRMVIDEEPAVRFLLIGLECRVQLPHAAELVLDTMRAYRRPAPDHLISELPEPGAIRHRVEEAEPHILDEAGRVAFRRDHASREARIAYKSFFTDEWCRQTTDSGQRC